MSNYRIDIKSIAAKALADLSAADQRRIAAKIDTLAANPRPEGSRKLAGVEDLYRIRSGDYRVIYQILDRQLVVLVIRIAHRREVYR
jgi:mRNA interferase RelE/StbE